jgi:catechol 2,3-dioxygenase-like lactoylglutathione lyase family enzyme
MADRAVRRDVPRITITSVLVDDQDKALRFYTEVLGFAKKTEVPIEGTSLAHGRVAGRPRRHGAVARARRSPAAGPFKQALQDDGIPFTSFAVDDVNAEYQRLRSLGVRFTQEPLEMESVTTAVFDDTCGNLIQLAATK